MGFFGLFRSLDKGQGMEVSVMDVQLDGVPGGLGPLRGEATQAATAEAGPGKLVRPPRALESWCGLSLRAACRPGCHRETAFLLQPYFVFLRS